MSGTQCVRFHEDVVGLLEGNASDDLRKHVASCDFCRDKAHDLESAVQQITKAGSDYEIAEPLADRLAKIAEDAEREASIPERISETRIKSEVPPAPVTPPVVSTPKRSKKALWLLLAACASIGTSAVIGVKLADHQRSPNAAATRAWHGKVGKIARSGAGPESEKKDGLWVGTKENKAALNEGAELKAGMHVWTDGKTRARFELDDGSSIVLDRATDVTIESTPRTLNIADGAILAEVAHIDNAPNAKVKTSTGEI